jgi:DNA-binding transcriptional MerR regulator
MYQIKTVASLTGINTDTVRAWERRYQAVVPMRDNKGRRLYSEANIERLKLLAGTLRQGYSIGKIANLDNNALKKLLNHHTVSGDSNHQEIINQIMSALKKYQLDRCEELLRRALISLAPLEFAQNILAPSMFQIGQLWHQEQISIAQEHMFSACIQRLVFSLINNMIPMANKQRSMIFSTLVGESHEFGILLASFLAANLRYTCHFLGTDLPGEEILLVNQHINADIIVISIVTSPPPDLIVKQLNQLAAKVGQSEIWVGGLGAQNLHERNMLPRQCLFNQTLSDFHSRATLFKADKLNQ